MTEKKIILVDMDDTICNLVGRCIHHHNLRWPEHLMHYEQVTQWDLNGIWHPECNEKAFFGLPGLYEELEIVDEYMVDEMRKIHEAYELIIVTASWPTAVVEKWNWLQTHLPFIPHENFCAWKKKYLINGDLLIDDASHNLLPFTEKGGKVIGIPRPWNHDIRDQVLFKPDGWKDMKRLIDLTLE